MMRRTFFALTMLAVAAGAGACAKATGELEVIGGEEDPVDTTPPDFLGCGATEAIDAGSGTKWSDLYRDLFGPTSAAKCANPACHGSEEGEGTKAVSFKCEGEKGCRTGMFDYGLVKVTRDQEEPEKSPLIGIVRHCDASGKTLGVMPKSPRSYYFSAASLARMQAWIKNGAPDD